MKVMLETTKWDDGIAAYNHVYVFEDFRANDRVARAIAYCPNGVGAVVKFKRPLKIDLRNRTFKEIE